MRTRKRIKISALRNQKAKRDYDGEGATKQRVQKNARENTKARR